MGEKTDRQLIESPHVPPVFVSSYAQPSSSLRSTAIPCVRLVAHSTVSRFVPATSGDHGLRDDILDLLHHSLLRFRLGSPCQRLPRDNRADVEYRMG